MRYQRLRDVTDTDIPRVLLLNESEVEWTSPLDEVQLRALLSIAAYQKVLEIESKVVGFLIALANDSAYDNENYRWFSSRYAEFLYIDRVVITREFAGTGLGRALYNDLISFASNHRYPRLVGEYSSQPKNVGSSIFHGKMGFVQDSLRRLQSTGKTVSMQSKVITCQG